MALVCLAAAGRPAAMADEIRPAAWAGRFYPADPARLKALLGRLAAQAAAAPLPALPAGRLRALIMPHAGYVYSGPIAARVLPLLAGQHYGKVVLIGPDHRVGLQNGAVSDADAWQTPLGTVRVHDDARRLCRSARFEPNRDSDRLEHSLEVVLPFLQYALDDFRLVPVVLGPGDTDALARDLGAVLDEDTLLAASSDLSHYLPDDEARRHDQQTLRCLMDLDARSLIERENGACGRYPLAVLVTIARQRGWHPVLVAYGTSADTAGDPDRVVGYAAVAFYGEKTMSDTSQDTADALTEAQGQVLVRLARQTIARRLNRPLSGADAAAQAAADPALQRPSGTFVTLKTHGQLRGCIGSLEPVESIAEGVRRNAVNAAFHDFRFSPLTAEELAHIDVEVSVLTVPQPLAYRDADELLTRLRPGVDGLIIRKGGHGATFLPQVWEQLPRTEDFLGHLCLKAGLSADAWRRGDLAVETYQVVYFEEHKSK